MLRLILVCAALLAAGIVLTAGPAFAIDPESTVFDDPAAEARYERLTSELRCLVCQNQTIADSNADLAKDLRAQVRRMMAEGASDEAILAYMSDRYGDFVRYRPPWSPRTWLLWLAPALLLAGGLLIAVRVVMRQAADDDSDDWRDPDEDGRSA